MRLLSGKIRAWPLWARLRWIIRQAWPVLGMLLGAVLLPAVFGEQIGFLAALVWLAVFLLAAGLSRGENAWGEAGRSFLDNQLGRQIHAACSAILPRLFQVRQLTTVLCTAVTAFIGELVWAFYARWLEQAKAQA